MKLKSGIVNHPTQTLYEDIVHMMERYVTPDVIERILAAAPSTIPKDQTTAITTLMFMNALAYMIDAAPTLDDAHMRLHIFMEMVNAVHDQIKAIEKETAVPTPNVPAPNKWAN